MVAKDWIGTDTDTLSISIHFENLLENQVSVSSCVHSPKMWPDMLLEFKPVNLIANKEDELP